MRNRLLSLILALAMVLAMGSASLAESDSDPLPAGRVDETDFTGKTVILHSNDVHGAIDGYAYMPALRDRFLSMGASDVLVVDAGDFSQGGIYVSVNKGKAAVDMMNAAGYDVVTLGNHEFDYGYDQLMENLKDAGFQAICCDVYLEETGETILPPSAVIETRSGLKLGFVGVETPETVSKVNPAKISGLSFAKNDQLYQAVQSAVDAIRGDCDLVIGLTHLGVDETSAANGYRSVDLLKSVSGIDFAIDAHSHVVMEGDEHDLPIQSTGTKFAYVGAMVIDDATGDIVDCCLLSTEDLPRDPDVAAAAQKIMDDVDRVYNTPFATTETRLNGDRAPGNRTEETNLGDLITDAMVWNVVKEGGLEQVEPNHVVSMVNGGSIRASIEPGDVTMRAINEVMPFGDIVALIYVSGDELLEALEASTFSCPEPTGAFPQTSGIEWTLDCNEAFQQGPAYTLNGEESAYYAPAGINRVTITAINGEPFDPAATYAVVATNFIAAGGDAYNVFNRAYNAGTGFDTGIPLDEAVAEYVAEALDGRITAGQYGQPRGSMTILPPEASEEAALEPAA